MYHNIFRPSRSRAARLALALAAFPVFPKISPHDKSRAWLSATIVVVLSLLPVPGWSAILYSNGPINGTINGYDINSIPAGGTFSISDSFTISSDSTVNEVSDIGLLANNIPLALSWVISTSPGGSGVVEAGESNADLATSFIGTTIYGLSLYSASFSVDGLDLSPATYYLELSDATVEGDSEFVFWDENDGPSLACGPGSCSPGSIGSESFQVDGYVNSVPEPASLTLVGSALVGLGAARRRKRKAA
jgi:PEP-CTERM motif